MTNGDCSVWLWKKMDQIPDWCSWGKPVKSLRSASAWVLYCEADEIKSLPTSVRINLSILKWHEAYISTPLQIFIWILWYSCNSVGSVYNFSVLFGVSFAPTSVVVLLWLVAVQMIITLDTWHRNCVCSDARVLLIQSGMGDSIFRFSLAYKHMPLGQALLSFLDLLSPEQIAQCKLCVRS